MSLKKVGLETMGEVVINEMEILERNIIRGYNELLKTLIEEGDMDTLTRVITDEDYRQSVLMMHTRHLRKRARKEKRHEEKKNDNCGA